MDQATHEASEVVFSPPPHAIEQIKPLPDINASSPNSTYIIEIINDDGTVKLIPDSSSSSSASYTAILQSTTNPPLLNDTCALTPLTHLLRKLSPTQAPSTSSIPTSILPYGYPSSTLTPHPLHLRTTYTPTLPFTLPPPILNATSYLPKPLTHPTLPQKIKKWLHPPPIKKRTILKNTTLSTSKNVCLTGRYARIIFNHLIPLLPKPHIILNGSDLSSPYIGSVEKKLRESFNSLKNTGGYVCIRDYDVKLLKGGKVELFGFFGVLEDVEVLATREEGGENRFEEVWSTGECFEDYGSSDRNY